ncbi:hypothetical protein NC652_025844 [Populus alba x Populus x berolinensis]|nr:hypothetical protein NC652_025844 [Populus alba x Populus x berolinensis]
MCGVRRFYKIFSSTRADDNTSLFIQAPFSNRRAHYPLLLRKMASFSVEDFVGNGVFKDLLPTLLEEG